jgi:hypothetical protein
MLSNGPSGLARDIIARNKKYTKNLAILCKGLIVARIAIENFRSVFGI